MAGVSHSGSITKQQVTAFASLFYMGAKLGLSN
jgi:hypothetical protein